MLNTKSQTYPGKGSFIKKLQPSKVKKTAILDEEDHTNEIEALT